MNQIERNSLVTLHYRLALTDDHIVEDIFDEEPIIVQLGQGEMAEGLELALIGLKPGDEQTIDIDPDLAFGYVDETLFQAIPRHEFDPLVELAPGLIKEFTTDDDETLPGTIVQFDENEVTVDLNHPLAGQTVRYSVKIVDVENIVETLH